MNDSRNERSVLDEAMRRAATHDDNLFDQCFTFALGWVGALPNGERFTTGDVRVAAVRAGIKPKEPRVWGAVMRSVSKAFDLKVAGATTEGRSHHGIARRWVRP